MSNASQLYGDSYEPDPVTEGAVAAAMAATDPGKRRFYDRLSVTLLVILTIAGAVFAGNSIYTVIKIHQQGQKIQQLSTCQNTFVNTYIAARADPARHQITKDELNALLSSCPGLKITVVVQK